MLQECWAVFRKELQLEWRQKYALNGLLLYVLSMVVVIALSFLGKNAQDPRGWNVMFWLVMLFVAVNAIAKSFMGENEGQQLYLYGLARPAAIIFSKTLYHAFLLFGLGMVALGAHALIGKMNIENKGLFTLAIALGSFAFSSNLTLVSAISSKADNKTMLLPVLGFPLVVPMLLTLIRVTQRAITGVLTAIDNRNELLLVGGFSLVMLSVSTILFPFVWKD